MRVAERQNSVSSDGDENSDNDDADMGSDMKNMSVSFHRNVTIIDSDKASGSSKKFSVQNSVLPEVSHYEFLFQFFDFSLWLMD